MSTRTVMRFTGVGGQGVLLAGTIFASAKNQPGWFWNENCHLYITSTWWCNGG